MELFLSRYTLEQQTVIHKYWDTVRWTRKHGNISDKIKLAEMDYWSQFDTASVISALEIHISKYANIKEHYTRGIIRNIAADKLGSSDEAQKDYTRGAKKQLGQHKPRKNRIVNYQQREWDYEALDYLDLLKNNGQLDAKRDELKKNPRYAKYLK